MIVLWPPLNPERPSEERVWAVWRLKRSDPGRTGRRQFILDESSFVWDHLSPVADEAGRTGVVLRCRRGHRTREPVLYSFLIDRARAAIDAVGEQRAQVTLPRRLFS